MKNRNVVLFTLCIVLLSFSSKDENGKILTQIEEDTLDYTSFRKLDDEEEDVNGEVSPGQYKKSSGGLSGGGIAGFCIAGVVVVIAAVAIALVLKGAVFGAATASTAAVATVPTVGVAIPPPVVVQSVAV